MSFFPFCIYFLSVINLFTVKKFFYVSNFYHIIDYPMHVFDHWSVGHNKFWNLFCLFYIFVILIIKQSDGKTFLWPVLGFIYALLFPLKKVYCIRVYWYWYLSLVVIENFMWEISNLDMQICFYCRLEEGCGEGFIFLLHL